MRDAGYLPIRSVKIKESTLPHCNASAMDPFFLLRWHFGANNVSGMKAKDALLASAVRPRESVRIQANSCISPSSHTDHSQRGDLPAFHRLDIPYTGRI